MRRMYADDAAAERLIAGGDPLVYEFYELGAPETPGDRAYSSSIVSPGKVGDMPLITFFCFRGDAGHDYGTIETKGYQNCLLRETENYRS